jgi:hypothetical protein
MMPQAHSAERPPKAVVTASEAARLLRLLRVDVTLEHAIELGLVCGSKVEGRWIYHPAAVEVAQAQETVGAVAGRVLDEWLLGSMPILANAISGKATSPTVSPKAARLLLQQILRQHHLEAIGVLTRENSPFLAVYHPVDQPEIDSQLAALQAMSRAGAPIRARDLPAPARPRRVDSWRTLLLQHGEFLGIGLLRGGTLLPWPAT